MKRESLIPEVPHKLGEKDIHNFKKHFQDRQRIENEAYSKQEIKDVFDEDKTLLLSPSELNSKTVINKVKEFDPDIAFIFGCDLIREPLLSTLPKYKINLHCHMIFLPAKKSKRISCKISLIQNIHSILEYPDHWQLI